jgi:hypothetical protein
MPPTFFLGIPHKNIYKEKYEDINEVIRIRKSKDRQRPKKK